jgi:hypothetical protein
MIQRVFVATCLIVTLASLSLLGLVWHQSNQAVNAAAVATRQLAEAHATNQAKMVELFTQAQSTNAEMLKQLQTMAKPAQSPPTSDWIPLSFKLTLETPDGPPAVGYEVKLQKGSAGLFEGGMRRESDSAGLVDFGVVHPGDWEFALSRSWDEQHIWMCQGSFNILPETKVVKPIVCPGPQTARCEVKFRVQWPADLAAKDLRVQATFVQAPTVFQSPLKWNVVNSSGDHEHVALLCGPGLKLIELDGSTKLDLWHHYESASEALSAQRVFGDWRSHPVRSESDVAAMDKGSFVLRRLIVLQPRARQNLATKGDRFAILAHAEASDEFGQEVETYLSDPDEGKLPLGSGWSLKHFKGGVKVKPSYWRQHEGRFTARPGQVNDWSLSLPEELLSVVREQLESKDDLKAKEPGAIADPRVDLQ